MSFTFFCTIYIKIYIMTKQIQINDRVVSIDNDTYLKVIEILPNNHYVVEMDTVDGILQYVVPVDEVEFVRSSTDPLIHLSEVAVIAFQLKEEIEEDFDGALHLWELVAKTEYPEYNQKLHYELGEEDGTDLVIVYVKL